MQIAIEFVLAAPADPSPKRRRIKKKNYMQIAARRAIDTATEQTIDADRLISMKITTTTTTTTGKIMQIRVEFEKFGAFGNGSICIKIPNKSAENRPAEYR